MIKKILMLFSFMVLFIAINCDNEPYEGDIVRGSDLCETASLITLEASNSFALSNIEDYNLKCQNYKNAIENQIEVCGDPRGELQIILEGLADCILASQTDCNLAIEATDLAFQRYYNSTSLEFEANCIAYVEAIENQILVCGDDGSLQALIGELGDCQPVFFDITGDWKLVSLLSNIPRDLNNNGEVTNDYFDDINCYTNETITFSADGTGTFFYRSYAQIEITSVDGSPDNIDYTIVCVERIENVEFTWYQDFNLIPVTLNSNGTVLNFFRNGDHIFIPRRGDFVATSTSPNLDTIIEDLIYEYIQI